jgi:hypothetical protein
MKSAAHMTEADQSAERPAFVCGPRGEIIKVIGAPRFNDFHKRWYVDGHRWIKSRRKWSSNALSHVLGEQIVEATDPSRAS